MKPKHPTPEYIVEYEPELYSCLSMYKTSVFPDRGHGKWGSSGGGGGVLRGMVQTKVFPTGRRLI